LTRVYSVSGRKIPKTNGVTRAIAVPRNSRSREDAASLPAGHLRPRHVDIRLADGPDQEQSEPEEDTAFGDLRIVYIAVTTSHRRRFF